MKKNVFLYVVIAVLAVALVGLGKRFIVVDRHPHRRLAEHLAGHPTDGDRPGRM